MLFSSCNRMTVELKGGQIKKCPSEGARVISVELMQTSASFVVDAVHVLR